MIEEVKLILIFVAGLIIGITIFAFIMTAMMTDILIASTATLVALSQLSVDYIQLAQICNITGGL